MTTPHAAFLLCAALAWHPASADLYKWVDNTGDVTYSSRPPPAGVDAERLQPVPQPSAEEIRQAEESVEKAQALARELEDERLRQEAAAAEEARLRAMASSPPPIVIEKPVYVPQPVYYLPVGKPPPKRPRRDEEPRRRLPPPPVFLPVPPPAP